MLQRRKERELPTTSQEWSRTYRWRMMPALLKRLLTGVRLMDAMYQLKLWSFKLPEKL